MAVASSSTTSAPYSAEDLRKVDLAAIPRHVAIIPDGNRRWARKASDSPYEGHRQGIEAVRHLVRAASQLGVKVVTFYTFSTENWARPKDEVELLLALLEASLVRFGEEILTSGLRFEVIGDPTPFSPKLVEQLNRMRERTANNQGLQLVLALNYGGRDDLRRAFQRMATECVEGRLQIQEISEALISSYVDTAPWGDPDLVIRTSGEMRISNFLLWQICYSELYMTETLWPDFTPYHFLEAVRLYQQRIKRLGA